MQMNRTDPAQSLWSFGRRGLGGTSNKGPDSEVLKLAGRVDGSVIRPLPGKKHYQGNSFVAILYFVAPDWCQFLDNANSSMLLKYA